MDNSTLSRRKFFVLVAKISGMALFMGSWALAEEKRRGAKPPASGSVHKDLDLPMADSGKETALALHYHQSHEEAKAGHHTMVEKNGVPWDKQTCGNCNFYKNVGTKKVKVNGAEKEVEVGTCMVLPQKLVTTTGICNSWAKKG